MLANPQAAVHISRVTPPGAYLYQCFTRIGLNYATGPQLYRQDSRLTSMLKRLRILVLIMLV
jgi:hypothetical protein